MTQKFIIRPATSQDWEQIAEIYNYYILHTLLQEFPLRTRKFLCVYMLRKSKAFACTKGG